MKNTLLLLAVLAACACGEAAEVDLERQADTGVQAPDVDAEVTGDAAIHGGDAALGVDELDQQDPSCTNPDWVPGDCIEGIGTTSENMGAGHIGDGPISYTQNPPSSGDHRGSWARWGEYSYLPPQRWLHNLEHGGIALLYHPCAAEETLQALRDFVGEQPDDYRGVMTPHPGLETAVAVVSWQWTWAAECVRPDEINTFLEAHYNQAPEDVPSDGSFSTGWLGR